MTAEAQPLAVRLTPELQFFLRQRGNCGDREVRPGVHETLGHVVQSLGVPLPEVGGLVLDGKPASAGVRAVGGLLEVLGVSRPQELAGPPQLLLDVHLGVLARRLRLLGVDTAYSNDAADDALVVRAEAEDRLLVTQDRGLLMRRALRRAAYVRGSRPDDQLADLLDRFELPLQPFSRCPRCNGGLEPVARDEVAHLLEPGTLRTQQDFRRCRACGAPYWRGAHFARLQPMVAEVLARRALPRVAP